MATRRTENSVTMALEEVLPVVLRRFPTVTLVDDHSQDQEHSRRMGMNISFHI